MQWLQKIADEVVRRQPEGEILIESGGSPSGTYHFGHLRELVICDGILLCLQKMGRKAKHIYYVDDLDGFRKIPPNVPTEYEKYLGRPLCDIPAPDGSDRSYADFFIQGLMDACELLGIEVEFVRSHQKYREGFFTEAIEKALDNASKIKNILETVSGHKVDNSWSPIQINEGGYLKKRQFVSIDKSAKTLTYRDAAGQEQTIAYAKGDVKLDWRVDWPARWWLLNVGVEPAGRDHSTKGGSFDTGLAIIKDVFGEQGPLPVPYDFINLAGDNKKMSASAGTGLDAAASAKVLPPEVLRYFILSAPPTKRLYFDPVDGMIRLVDEYAQRFSEEGDDKLVEFSRRGTEPMVTRIPFSHLVASYQAALRDVDKTIEVIKRTETKYPVDQNRQILENELKYIDAWLENWAPEDVKFELAKELPKGLSEEQTKFLSDLADKIDGAPEGSDGEWFHKTIYDLPSELEPNQKFKTLYRTLIGQDRGPRAGWFLSILPREWLLKRLRLEG